MCQVVLTADPALDAAQLPGAGVLRWTDVCALAERLRGPGSYVARRLRSALDRYQEELGQPTGRGRTGRAPSPSRRSSGAAGSTGPGWWWAFWAGCAPSRPRRRRPCGPGGTGGIGRTRAGAARSGRTGSPGTRSPAAVDALAVRADGRGAPGETAALRARASPGGPGVRDDLSDPAERASRREQHVEIARPLGPASPPQTPPGECPPLGQGAGLDAALPEGEWECVLTLRREGVADAGLLRLLRLRTLYRRDADPATDGRRAGRAAARPAGPVRPLARRPGAPRRGR